MLLVQYSAGMHDDPLSAFLGRPLRELRQAARLTQLELAKRVQVTAQAIGSFERRQSEPRLRTALRLLDELCRSSLR